MKDNPYIQGWIERGVQGTDELTLISRELSDHTDHSKGGGGSRTRAARVHAYRTTQRCHSYSYNASIFTDGIANDGVTMSQCWPAVSIGTSFSSILCSHGCRGMGLHSFLHWPHFRDCASRIQATRSDPVAPVGCKRNTVKPGNAAK